MLSLTGKLAALYMQNMRDPVIIEAVNEIEDLTTSLSRKIWQKIMILNQPTEALGAVTRLPDLESRVRSPNHFAIRRDKRLRKAQCPSRLYIARVEGDPLAQLRSADEIGGHRHRSRAPPSSACAPRL